MNTIELVGNLIHKFYLNSRSRMIAPNQKTLSMWNTKKRDVRLVNVSIWPMLDTRHWPYLLKCTSNIYNNVFKWLRPTIYFYCFLSSSFPFASNQWSHFVSFNNNSALCTSNINTSIFATNKWGKKNFLSQYCNVYLSCSRLGSTSHIKRKQDECGKGKIGQPNVRNYQCNLLERYAKKKKKILH